MASANGPLAAPLSPPDDVHPSDPHLQGPLSSLVSESSFWEDFAGDPGCDELGESDFMDLMALVGCQEGEEEEEDAKKGSLAISCSTWPCSTQQQHLHQQQEQQQQPQHLRQQQQPQQWFRGTHDNAMPQAPTSPDPNASTAAPGVGSVTVPDPLRYNSGSARCVAVQQ